VRSSLESAKWAWSGTVLIAVPLIMLATGVVVLSATDVAIRLYGGEGILSQDDLSAAQWIFWLVLVAVPFAFWCERHWIAALKHIGQLTERVEDLEKMSHE
jgi:hypothetical protein